METGAIDEIMLVGVARMWATPEAFIRGFESSPGVIAGINLSMPPTESDLGGLTLIKRKSTT